ncbi:MAG: glycosyltransferase family 39 protein, partial [Planctomycetota bacterium]|nr:glycosyltransferase family 39 protein [Planctomycetota bacterium]
MTQGRGSETELGDGNLSRRLPAYLAAILLTALIIQATLFAARKGPTFDEVIDLAAGYAYLRTGTYRLCPEHPALATVLSSAPLLLLDLRDPADDPEFSAQRRWQFALGTLHQNWTPAARILFLARLPSILLLGLLGWLLYRFGAAEFGPWGGVGALFLLATSPTFIAHSALATGDSIVAVFSFAAFVSIRRCLDRITWPRILLAG